MSARSLAIVSSLVLAVFLVLRPLASSLGTPTLPDVRGASRLQPAAGGGEPPAVATPGGAGASPAVAGAGAGRGADLPPEPGPEHAAESAAIERLIFERTNAERRAAGLAGLLPEATLAAVARAHSADMLRRGFFDHVNLDGERPEDRVAAAHRRLIGVVSENIWQGTGFATGEAHEIAGKIVQSWMHSASHRENVLRRESTHLGVGLAWAGGCLYATQDFAAAWAFLDTPLAPAVAQGAAVTLLSHPFAGSGEAREFDLWSAARGLRASPPAPPAGARLDAEPGIYRVRFYFPQPGPGRFAVVSGPRIEVR
jgi:uncharacterized protein YkwD